MLILPATTRCSQRLGRYEVSAAGGERVRAFVPPLRHPTGTEVETQEPRSDDLSCR